LLTLTLTPFASTHLRLRPGALDIPLALAEQEWRLHELDFDLRLARRRDLVADAAPLNGHALGVAHRDALREAVRLAFLLEARLRKLLDHGRVGDWNGSLGRTDLGIYPMYTGKFGLHWVDF
jgi:hypothetical protein